MTDHTPTMARVEDMYAWAYAWRIEDGDEDTDLSAMRESQRAEFQRALAAHDRKIAAEALREAAEDEAAERARLVVEDALVDLRDSGIFVLRRNGLTIEDRDSGGRPSGIIRMGFEDGWRIALKDRADRIEQGGES